MASSAVKIAFRILVTIAILSVAFYISRPLYWKISATVHDIRHNKQSVSQGISEIVKEAQKSVGWYHDESDSGVQFENKGKSAVTRRLLFKVL